MELWCQPLLQFGDDDIVCIAGVCHTVAVAVAAAAASVAAPAAAAVTAGAVYKILNYIKAYTYYANKAATNSPMPIGRGRGNLNSSMHRLKEEKFLHCDVLIFQRKGWEH
uniref:Uncharacterized protein n=1 Tax=Glossina austeni TaxID=7395 RepID=A0A1A9VS99_GLOAU